MLKRRMGNSYMKFVILTFFSLLLSALFSMSSYAQFADSPCDASYYESLEARAWLEAQREITQNQNLISKPDSVLEYTCFDKHLGALAQNAPAMFSESTRWGGSPVGDMETSLNNLPGKAFSDYDSANFDHNLLGGRVTNWSPVNTPSEADGTAYNADTSITAGTYSCDIMQAVWMKAKCMNFIDSPSNDGFFTFAEYASSSDDKRAFPDSCGGGVPWDDNIRKADGSSLWQADTVDTYLNKIFLPNGCGSGPTSRINTGLLVKDEKANVSEYFEHVCVVPGCYWQPSGRSAGSCTR